MSNHQIIQLVIIITFINKKSQLSIQKLLMFMIGTNAMIIGHSLVTGIPAACRGSVCFP